MTEDSFLLSLWIHTLILSILKLSNYASPCFQASSDLVFGKAPFALHNVASLCLKDVTLHLGTLRNSLRFSRSGLSYQQTLALLCSVHLHGSQL